jgi:hypothetical protein
VCVGEKKTYAKLCVNDVNICNINITYMHLHSYFYRDFSLFIIFFLSPGSLLESILFRPVLALVAVIRYPYFLVQWRYMKSHASLEYLSGKLLLNG